MSQLQVTGEAKIRDLQGPVVANSGVITALDGAANQYVRGDGTLASFPTSGGGGSSVSYYLNGSVNQGTFAGSTYYEMGEDAITGTGTNFSISTDGLLAQFITDAGVPDVTEIPSGNWNIEFYMGVSASSGSLASFYVEIYKWNGSTFTLLATNVATPEFLTNTTTVDAYFTSVAMPTTSLAVTDRLAIRIYANVASKTVTIYTEDNRLCQVVTTFSKGMLSMNNLTDQSQYLTIGTSGTNFNIDSSGDTHTFNLPTASATNTGKLSATDWSTFNNKQNALTNPITGTGASGRVAYYDGTTSITSEAAFNYDSSTNRLGVNTNTPNASIGANAGTDSGYSLLLKNADNNYNGIGFGTDSTYGNLIATEKLGTAPARNLTLLNQSGFVSLTEAGNLGIGLLTPNTGVDIYNGTSAYLWLHTATSGTGGTDGVRLALFNTNGANLRNFEGSFSITAEGDFSVITLGAENFKINSSDGSIYQSKVANAMLKSVSGVITAAVAGTDYLAPASISGTTNTVAKFASSSSIGNSNITDTGSLITLGSTTNISSGNFGVGTSSPAVAGVGIDIYSATSAGLRFHTATSGTTVSDGAGINFSAANNLGITNYEAGAIDIVTNGNSGVYINSSGLVGINGATPSTALTVNGEITQSSVTSSLLKTNGSGTIIAAVAGTDYVSPSALSGYLPLSGGTLTGSLGGTSATFSGDVTIGGAYKFSIASSRMISGSTDWALNNNANTVNMILVNNSTYAVTLAGALSGTSALFSSTLTASKGTFNGTTSEPIRIERVVSGSIVGRYSLAISGGGIFSLYDATADADRLTIATNGDATFIGTAPILGIKSTTTGNVFLRMYQGVDVVSSMFYNNATSTLTISNNNSGIQFNTSGVTNAFNLASTGAATFSSSVTAGTGTSSGYATLNLIDSGTGSARYASIRKNYDSPFDLRIRASNSESAAPIVFDLSNAVEAMRITSTGNVGIGTSSPNGGLSVVSPSSATAISIWGRSGDNIGALRFQSNTGASTYATIYSDASSLIFENNGSERMKIGSAGLLTITSLISTYTTLNTPNMWVNPADGTVSRSTASSLRFKENIKDWNGNGLNTILALKPKTFTYKKYYYNNPELEMLGLIAEEVAEVSPFLAEYENEDRSGKVENVRYATIVVPLIKAVQELKYEIEELKALINK